MALYLPFWQKVFESLFVVLFLKKKVGSQLLYRCKIFLLSHLDSLISAKEIFSFTSIICHLIINQNTINFLSKRKWQLDISCSSHLIPARLFLALQVDGWINSFLLKHTMLVSDNWTHSQTIECSLTAHYLSSLISFPLCQIFYLHNYSYYSMYYIIWSIAW